MGVNYNNPPQNAPTDKVLEMKNQGLSNNQIIQNLQREGYMQSQIFDAMNQADIKAGVTNMPINYNQNFEAQNPMTMGAGPIPQMPQPPQAPKQQGPPMGPPQGPPMMPLQDPNMGMNFTPPGSVSTEELIEALINEKWNDLLTDVNKIIDWKEKAESRLVKVETGFEEIKKNFDLLHKAIVGKVGEYDKHILDVGAEIKAMEKVFQKVLPTFVENVNELSRITDEIKKK